MTGCFWLRGSREVTVKPSARAASSEGLTGAEGSTTQVAFVLPYTGLSPGCLKVLTMRRPASPNWERSKQESTGQKLSFFFLSPSLGSHMASFCYILLLERELLRPAPVLGTGIRLCLLRGAVSEDLWACFTSTEYGVVRGASRRR